MEIEIPDELWEEMRARLNRARAFLDKGQPWRVRVSGRSHAQDALLASWDDWDQLTKE